MFTVKTNELMNSNRFVAALHQETPVIVDIIGDDIVKTELPLEPENKDESSKAYVFTQSFV